jgi:hypothetical protein
VVLRVIFAAIDAPSSIGLCEKSRTRHQAVIGLDPNKIQPQDHLGVAQLVERVLWEHEAAGSRPVTETTIFGGVAQRGEQLLCKQ